MNNERLHILFLPRWYPNRYDPMPGLFIRRHAEAVSKYARVTVVYVHASEKGNAGFEVVITDEPELSTVVVYFPFSKSKVFNVLRFFRANLLGIRIVKKTRGLPDITHVHVLTRLALIAWWLRLRHGIPFMITEHWSRYIPGRNEFKGVAKKWLTRFLVRNASMVTTVTRNLAEAMMGHGLYNTDYRILPNVVDTELFKPRIDKNNDLKCIIHVSCFEDRSKNISGLLRVLKQLSAKRDDFECILVGDGMDFEAMKLLAKALGLMGKIRFTGLLEGTHLASTMASADFLVLFSHYENLPVVIPEALACGLPVVASRVGGIAEVVDHNSGLLVEARQESALLQALDYMLDHFTDFNPAVLREKIVENNSPDAVGKLLHGWYLQVLNNERRHGRIS